MSLREGYRFRKQAKNREAKKEWDRVSLKIPCPISEGVSVAPSQECSEEATSDYQSNLRVWGLSSTPAAIRTRDLQLRRLTLYPAELRVPTKRRSIYTSQGYHSTRPERISISVGLRIAG
jgi:hypothetical protein